ncbi:hypothetical protein Tco_0431718 [Tanacetum coccineum]
MSSVKAEYVDVVGCCASILWMKSQHSDYGIHYKMVPIFCDNTNSIAISNNPVLHSRTKHIDIRYHFIRDHILKGDIELHFIPTEYQLADIFTKPLDEPTFTRLKAELGMEFWSTTVAFDPFPSTGEPEKCPLKEFLIKFSVLNGQKPLTLDFKTFCSSTGLDYNNGKYVDHPTPEVMKKELGKISINSSYLDKIPVLKNSFPVAWRILFTFVIRVLGENYSSTEQDKKFGLLPPILSNSNFTKDPSKVTDIELTPHMIAVNNRRDSMSPPPLVAKPKKMKSRTVTSTLPKSQGPKASGALSKKSKRPKDIQLASTGLPSTLDEDTRKSKPFPEGTVTHPKDSGGNVQPLDKDLTFMTFDEGTAKTTPRLEGSFGDKGSGGNIPPTDMEPINPTVADLLGIDVRAILLSEDEAHESEEDILGAGEEMDENP